MKDHSGQQFHVDTKHDPKKWWEVNDRTTGKVVKPASWSFNRKTGKVTDRRQKANQLAGLIVTAFLFATYVLCCGGCAHCRKVPLVRQPYGAPSSVAVLPFLNYTNDVAAPTVVRRLAHLALKRRGYQPISLEETDRKLRQLGITQGGQLRSRNPTELAQTLEVSALLYGELEKLKKMGLLFALSAGRGSHQAVGVGAELVDPSGNCLWSHSESIHQTQTRESTGDTGRDLGIGCAAALLINWAAERAGSHMLFPLMKEATDKLFATLPHARPAPPSPTTGVKQTESHRQAPGFSSMQPGLAVSLAVNPNSMGPGLERAQSYSFPTTGITMDVPKVDPGIGLEATLSYFFLFVDPKNEARFKNLAMEYGFRLGMSEHTIADPQQSQEVRNLDMAMSLEFYLFPQKRWRPFFGGSVGVSTAKIQNVTTVPSGRKEPARFSPPSYRVDAGLAVHLVRSCQAWIALNSDWRSYGRVSTLGDIVDIDDFTTHDFSLRFGTTWTFWTPPCPPRRGCRFSRAPLQEKPGQTD